MPSLAPIAKAALLPMHAVAVVSGQKSFQANPVLASPRLNRWGLHVARIRAAEAMSAWRRKRLTRFAAPEHREAIDRDGFVVIRDVLPPAMFAALRREVEETPLPAHENRSGDTVSRFIDLPPPVLKSLPALRELTHGPLFQGLLRYAASFNHAPLVNINTTIVAPDGGPKDANTHFHSDTFHATAKCWYFVRDVEMADGPFTFVRGSHRLNPARIEWERELSLVAATHPNGLNRIGSLRVNRAEMAAMGYDDIVAFDVPANSLVVADTHGFHARKPAARPSQRLAVYGSLRANPFNPIAGLDWLSLLGLGGRKNQIGNILRETECRIRGVPDQQPLVGAVKAGDPAIR